MTGIGEDAIGGEIADPPTGQDPALRDAFLEQLQRAQTSETVHGVLAALDAWGSLGGLVEYGRGGQTSCFLMARNQSHPDGSIWPVTIYPGGKCEVVFQHLINRKPFDDPGLREELRQRLSKVPGVVLPEAKLELRPGFELSVLSDPTAREVFLEHLAWFFHRANPAVTGTS